VSRNPREDVDEKLDSATSGFRARTRGLDRDKCLHCPVRVRTKENVRLTLIYPRRAVNRTGKWTQSTSSSSVRKLATTNRTSGIASSNLTLAPISLCTMKNSCFHRMCGSRASVTVPAVIDISSPLPSCCTAVAHLRRALSTSIIIRSAICCPISHLSRSEMKILNGRESNASGRDANISSCGSSWR